MDRPGLLKLFRNAESAPNGRPSTRAFVGFGMVAILSIGMTTIFAGCQSQHPTDPFLGRSTIPPPSTNFTPPAGANQPYYTPPTNSRPPSMQPSFGQPSGMTPPSLPPAGGYNPSAYPNYGGPAAVPNYNPPNIPSYPGGSAYPNGSTSYPNGSTSYPNSYPSGYPNNAPNNYPSNGSSNFPSNIPPTYPPSLPPTSASGYGAAPGYGTSPPLNNSFTTPSSGGAPSWPSNSTPTNPPSIPYNGSNSFGAPVPQYMPPGSANYYPSNPNAFAWQPQPNPNTNPYGNPNLANAGNPYGNPYANPYYYPNGMATGYTNPNPIGSGTGAYPGGAYPGGGYPNNTNRVANASAYQQNMAVPDNALVRVISPRAGGGYTGGSVLPSAQTLPVSTPTSSSPYPNFVPPSAAIPGSGDSGFREPRRLDNMLPPVEWTDLTPVEPKTAARFTNRPAAFNAPAQQSVDVPLVQPDANR